MAIAAKNGESFYGEGMGGCRISKNELLIRYGLARNGLHATGSAASLAASGHQQERQKTFFPESQGIVARHLLFNGCKGLRRSKGRSCNYGKVHHKGTFLNKDMAIQHKSLVIKNRP